MVTEALTVDDAFWRAIHDLHCEQAWAGVSRLRRAGWVVKVVAADSIALRRVMAEVRRLVYAALGKEEPHLRRVGFS